MCRLVCILSWGSPAVCVLSNDCSLGGGWEEKKKKKGPRGMLRLLINEVRSPLHVLSEQQLCQNSVYSCNSKEYFCPVETGALECLTGSLRLKLLWRFVMMSLHYVSKWYALVYKYYGYYYYYYYHYYHYYCCTWKLNKSLEDVLMCWHFIDDLHYVV